MRSRQRERLYNCATINCFSTNYSLFINTLVQKGYTIFTVEGAFPNPALQTPIEGTGRVNYKTKFVFRMALDKVKETQQHNIEEDDEETSRTVQSRIVDEKWKVRI